MPTKEEIFAQLDAANVGPPPKEQVFEEMDKSLFDRAHEAASGLEEWGKKAIGSIRKAYETYTKTFGPIPGVPLPGIGQVLLDKKEPTEAVLYAYQTAAQTLYGLGRATVTFPAGMAGGVVQSAIKGELKPTQVKKNIEEVQQKIEGAAESIAKPVLGETTQEAQDLLGGAGVPFEVPRVALGALGEVAGGEEGKATGEILGDVALLAAGSKGAKKLAEKVLGKVSEMKPEERIVEPNAPPPAVTPPVSKDIPTIKRQIAKEPIIRVLAKDENYTPTDIVKSRHGAENGAWVNIGADSALKIAEGLEGRGDLVIVKYKPELLNEIGTNLFGTEASKVKNLHDVGGKAPRGEGYWALTDKDIPKEYVDKFLTIDELRDLAGQSKEPVGPTAVESNRLTREGIPGHEYPVTITDSMLKEINEAVNEAPKIGLGGKILQKFKIEPEPKMITMDEAKALRLKLRAEAKASVEGWKAGRDAERAKIMERVNETQEGRELLSDYAIKHLPKEERGRFINAITKAQTDRQMVKVLTKMDEHIDRLNRRTLKQEIKKVVVSALQDKNLAVEHKAAIKRYVKNQRILKKSVLDQMPVEKVRFLWKTLDDIYTKGKEKRLSEIEQYEDRKQQFYDELNKSTSSPMNSIPEAGTEPFQRSVFQAGNAAQRIDKAITFIDPLLNSLDGMVTDPNLGWYDGFLHQNMKRPIDAMHDLYLITVDDVMHKPLRELQKKHGGLSEKESRDLEIYAASKQPDGMGIRKLLDSGLTQKEIDSVKLNDKQKAYYDWWKKTEAAEFPVIKEYMRKVYNIDLKKVEDYYPLITDWSLYDQLEISDRLGGAMEWNPRSKTVADGFTKQRTGGKQKLNLDFLDTTSRHVNDVQYMLALGEQIKMYSEIFGTRDKGREALLKTKYGDVGVVAIRDWLDTLARKGGTGHGGRIEAIDFMRRNTSVAAMTFRVLGSIIQLTSLPDSGVYIHEYVLNGAKDIATSRKWREFVLQMPEVRHRVFDDPAISEKTAMKKAADFGYRFITAPDRAVAMSTAAGSYEYYCAKKGIPVDLENPSLEGIMFAENVVRQAQSSAHPKDLPQALSRGALTGNKSVDLAMFQFQNFLLKRWNTIKHDVWKMGIKDKSARQAIPKVMWLALGTAAATGARVGYKRTMDRVLGKDTLEDEPGFWDNFAKEALGNIPIVGNIAGALTYGSSPVPIIQATNDIFRGISDYRRAKSDYQKRQAAIRATRGLAGPILGIPGTSAIAQEASRMNQATHQQEQKENKDWEKEMRQFIKSRQERDWFPKGIKGEKK